MRRKLMCGLAAPLWASVLSAQPVPARDLWEFPLGAILEPAALAVEPGLGLWNPAAASLPPGLRIRFGVAALGATANQGVQSQLAGVVWDRGRGSSAGFSVARSAIASLVRTESDPQNVGSIEYSSLLISGVITKRLFPNVTLGGALRLRQGTADTASAHALAADVGVIIDSLPLRSARVGVSSFLWRPGREVDDRPALVAAGDFRVVGRGTGELRAGYTFNGVNRGAKESGPYAVATIGPVEARGTYSMTRFAGRSLSRVRSGLALHYARFTVGVAREEGASGLGPIYQFTLSSIVR